MEERLSAERPVQLGQIELNPQRSYERSRLMDALRRFRQSRSAQLGLILISTLVILSIFVPIAAQMDSTNIDYMAILQPPSAQHLFGTDDLGRDLLARVLYGTRTSILVGVFVALGTGILGLFLGALAGFYTRLDGPIMRAMDILMAFPSILLALGVVAVLGPQLINIIIALVIPSTPRTARVVRGAILSLRQQEFVTAARAVGAPDGRIILRHLLPNCVSVLLVQQSYILALAILVEATLNFLGVGVPPEVATLGGSISDARAHLRYAPWMSMFPGMFISMLVFGFNLLGDGLRDILDPRMRL